jgi:tetratricopeptide (TPR) repeat protein
MAQKLTRIIGLGILMLSSGPAGAQAPAAPRGDDNAPSGTTPSDNAPSDTTPSDNETAPRDAAPSQSLAAESTGSISAEQAAADALIEQGIELRKRGEDLQAVATFERALKSFDSGRGLAQLALGEQALGRWLDAREHLQSALGRSADPWIAGHRATLLAALEVIDAHLGSLELSCDVSGAEVVVDGRPLGRTPLAGPLLLEAGQNVIQLSAKGYFAITREVQIDVGRLSRVEVHLTPRPPPTASLAPNAARGSNGLSGTQPASNLSFEIVQYSSFGLAALGLTAGVTGYVMRERNVRIYNDDARCSTAEGTSRSDECPDEAAAWRLGEGLAIGGFAAAGVFGALGVYLTLRGSAPARDTAWSCDVGPLAASCARHF